LETYAEPKELAQDPHYRAQRREALAGLSEGMIDEPIVEIVNGLNRLPYCYTLQSCFGHFVYDGQDNPHNLEALPLTHNIARVEYRIAYVAFCIENSASGKRLLEDLRGIPTIDPENIQFCCAEWFWERHVNSYALQVEPDRFKRQDSAVLDYGEALRVEKIRNEFFIRLDELLRSTIERDETG